MTKYALLIERSAGVKSFQNNVSIELKPASSTTEILASVAVVGEPMGYRGKSASFEDQFALRTALNEARIADIEVNTAIQNAMSGWKGFAYITSDNAKSLGLLEDHS